MSISTSDGPFCDAAQNGPVTRDALICGYLRTPFGRYGGVLARLRPDLMAAHVLRAIVERHHLAPATVDDVVFGCANQAGEDNRNVARMALLLGLPRRGAGADREPPLRLEPAGAQQRGAGDLERAGRPVRRGRGRD